MIKERQNKTSGLMEWIFTYIAGGLPKVQVMQGKTWFDVLNSDHPSEIQAIIEKEVDKRINVEYKHIDKKLELRDMYRQMVLTCFTEASEDDQDPEFIALSEMQAPLLEIVGAPAED